MDPKASQIHGYTRDEYLALTIAEIDPIFDGDASKVWSSHLQALQQTGFLVVESEHRRKDGSTFPVEINASYIRLERDYILAVVRDITERKRTDRRIRQLNSVYAVLSGINELIVREREIQKMFEGACRIAVEKGGVRLAWIGLLKEPGKPIELAAHAGASPDTLAALQRVFTSIPRSVALHEACIGNWRPRCVLMFRNPRNPPHGGRWPWNGAISRWSPCR